MSKIGRNSPCPCGSGKKYKKCCGSNNVVPFVPLHLERELETLKHDLFQFAKQHYQTELDEAIEIDLDGYMENTTADDKDGYSGLVYPWYLFNEPLSENEDETVFDKFLAMKEAEITNERVKETFLSWKDALSFIYEIVSVEKESNIIVRDMTTNLSYPVILPNIQKSHVGSYLIGTLIPFISTNQFLHVTANLPKGAKGEMEEIVHEFENDSALVSEVFPEFLAHLYGATEEDMEEDAGLVWQAKEYETIADEFLINMEGKNRDDNPINFALAFWHFYSSKHMPRVTKRSTILAALDYLMCSQFYAAEGITQTALAKEYDVSPGTISNHYKKMAQELEAFEQAISF